LKHLLTVNQRWGTQRPASIASAAAVPSGPVENIRSCQTRAGSMTGRRSALTTSSATRRSSANVSSLSPMALGTGRCSVARLFSARSTLISRAVGPVQSSLSCWRRECRRRRSRGGSGSQSRRSASTPGSWGCRFGRRRPDVMTGTRSALSMRRDTRRLNAGADSASAMEPGPTRSAAAQSPSVRDWSRSNWFSLRAGVAHASTSRPGPNCHSQTDTWGGRNKGRLAAAAR
jgi:hypothetical protein